MPLAYYAFKRQNEELDVDFVAWCSLVLEKLIEATHISPEARSIGVDQYQFARTMFGFEITQPTNCATRLPKSECLTWG